MLRLLATIVAVLAGIGGAAAGCFPVAQAPSLLHRAAYQPAALPDGASLRLSFLGHASFLLETRGGVTAVTDFNAIYRPAFAPDIVTMNNSHGAHWTDRVDPETRYALRGWNPAGGLAEHDVRVGDLRVRNVPTSVRGRVGDFANSNSIFVFELDDLCVAHLGHLHHPLANEHLAELGIIDVLLIPVDGMWTMPQATAVEVVEQLRPSVVIPMHYFAPHVVQSFVEGLGDRWTVRWLETPEWSISRGSLPFREVVVLPAARPG